MKPLAIYIHWPFCLSKCPYCDFLSFPETDTNIYNEYANFLLIDLKNSLKKIDYSPLISTIFFGGGTPSLMAPQHVEKILNFLCSNYAVSPNVEITLEANPATFTENKILDFQKAGINRLSLGIQSFQQKNLEFLGRIYNSPQALKAADIVARKFSNYSFDLMYGYQIQTQEDLEKDLSIAMEFKCPHLSCYQLTFEENTPFFHKLSNGEISDISEKKSIILFNFIEKYLKQYSLKKYEISNYAKPNFQSKHNLTYWRYEDYLGVGLGAHSRLTLNNQKTKVIKEKSLKNWIQKIQTKEKSFIHTLSDTQQLKEKFIMGLRLTEGICSKELYSQFPSNLIDAFMPRIQILQQQGLFTSNKNKIKLSHKGTLLMNEVLKFIFN